MTSAAAPADLLLSLHHAAQPLVLPNAWDVGSALAVERAGAAAVATTSSGVAEALGYPDGEVIPPAEMLAAVSRIAAAVSVPVTADMEAGYGLAAEELVGGLLEAGAGGLNLEDTDRSGGEGRLVEVEQQAERVAAIRSAADRAGVHLVINARVDVFLRGQGSLNERVEEALRRARAYLEAGADCAYPIGLTDADAIRRMVGELEAPLNILLRPGAPTVNELAAMGVRRISIGGALARMSMDHAADLARRLLSGDDAPFRRPPDG